MIRCECRWISNEEIFFEMVWVRKFLDASLILSRGQVRGAVVNPSLALHTIEFTIFDLQAKNEYNFDVEPPIYITKVNIAIMSDSGEIEVEAVSGYQVLPKEVTEEIGSIKLFNKWSYEDVEIRDISLT